MRGSVFSKLLFILLLGTVLIVASDNQLKRNRSVSPAGDKVAHLSDSDDSEKPIARKLRNLRGVFSPIDLEKTEPVSLVDTDCERIIKNLKIIFAKPSAGETVPCASPIGEQRKILEEGASLLNRLRVANLGCEDIDFDERKSNALADEMMGVLRSFGPTMWVKIRKAVTAYNEEYGRSGPIACANPLANISFEFQQCRTADRYAAPWYALPSDKVMAMLDQCQSAPVVQCNINALFLDAVIHNNLDLVKHLVEKGALIHYRGPEGENAFHHAARNCSIALLDYLLGVAAARHLLSELLEQTDSLGSTPLYVAVKTNQAEAVRRLLDAGANWKIYMIVNGANMMSTALHFAASSGCIETLDCIIAWAEANKILGEVLEATDFSKCTALYLAVKYDQKEAVIHLLDAGANLNTCPVTPEINPERKVTPLHIAAANGNLAMLELIIEWARRKNVLARLIDGQDDAGSTALHHAVEYNDPLVVTYLLAEGADEGIPDDSGKTPLQLAIKQEKRYLVELLQELVLQADVNTDSEESISSDESDTDDSD